MPNDTEPITIVLPRCQWQALRDVIEHDAAMFADAPAWAHEAILELKRMLDRS